jgi:Flp pilus assembly protein TadG
MGAGTLMRRLAADRRGASAVEMALVSPIFVLLLLATYDVARAFSARLDLVEAAARSAELATSLGEVRTDYSFLQSEALSAATAAGQSSPAATVDAWLECNGVRQGSINGVCPAGQPYARYVSVEVTGTYQPLFPAGGFIAPGGVPIGGEATVRIQ